MGKYKITPRTKSSTWQAWLEYKPDKGWAYLDRSLAAQGVGGLGGALSRMDNTMSGMQETWGIFAIECLPIGEGNMEPNPGIETGISKRE